MYHGGYQIQIQGPGGDPMTHFNLGTEPQQKTIYKDVGGVKWALIGVGTTN